MALNVEIESRTAQTRLLDEVRRVIMRLSDLEREALECAYFEGLPHTEIVQKTGQPRGTLKTCIHHAREALKKVRS